jgi:hypothetical protein
VCSPSVVAGYLTEVEYPGSSPPRRFLVKDRMPGRVCQLDRSEGQPDAADLRQAISSQDPLHFLVLLPPGAWNGRSTLIADTDMGPALGGIGRCAWDSPSSAARLVPVLTLAAGTWINRGGGDVYACSSAIASGSGCTTRGRTSSLDIDLPASPQRRLTSIGSWPRLGGGRACHPYHGRSLRLGGADLHRQAVRVTLDHSSSRNVLPPQYISLPG